MVLARRFWLHAVILLALIVVTTVIYRERHRRPGERQVSAGLVIAVAGEEPAIPSRSATTWVMPSEAGSMMYWWQAMPYSKWRPS
jgi:hypothetical protein